MKLWNTSSSEQAPISGFYRFEKSERKNRGFLGPSSCDRKVDPERYVSCGLYELLLSKVAHQMSEKLSINPLFPFFFNLLKINSTFKICTLFSGSKPQEKPFFF